MKLSISIITGLFFLISACSRDYDSEKIYVPNNYIGWIFIIYDQKGSPKESVDKYRIYKVSQDGILFTGFKVNWGVINSETTDIQCYYTDSVGQAVKWVPACVYANEFFKNRYRDSLVALPLPPHGIGKYDIYPIIIDTLKNGNNYEQGHIPITEKKIDSLLNNL